MFAALFAWTAVAAPVLTAPTQSPLERCLSAAEGEIDAAVPAPTPLTGEVERIALVIGVPCHRTAGIPTLAYSSRDAARVAETLRKAGYEVRLLKGLVDRADFLAELDQAERALALDGELLLYFSGHGVLREQAGRVRRYLVFSDTELTAVSRTGLPVANLDDRISRLPARKRTIIQDTCFAAHAGGKSLGLATREGMRGKGIATPEAPLELREGDVRLYASKFFEQAVESPSHRSSLYTHHLLSSFEEGDADLNGDGCVDLREGHAWARIHTSADREGFQTPQGQFIEASPDLLGCRPQRPSRGVVTTPDDQNWEVEIRDLSGKLVQRGAGAVPAGRYQVHVGYLMEEDGVNEHRTVLDDTMRVGAGAWVDLEERVRRRGPLHEITAHASLRGPNERLPPLGVGLTAIRVWPKRRGWRPTLGLQTQVGGGRLQSDNGPNATRATEVSALVGHTSVAHLGDSRLGLGPLIGGGVAWLARRDADCTSCTLITRPSATASAWLRGRLYAARSMTLAVDLGVTGFGDTRRGVRTFPWVPSLRIGVGPAL